MRKKIDGKKYTLNELGLRPNWNIPFPGKLQNPQKTPVFSVGCRNYGTFILLLFGVFLSACVGAHQNSQVSSESWNAQNSREAEAYWEKVGSLQDDLAALNQQVDLLEARQVAETAITYSNQLAEEYQLVHPAVLHNVLIRGGAEGSRSMLPLDGRSS